MEREFFLSSFMRVIDLMSESSLSLSERDIIYPRDYIRFHDFMIRDEMRSVALGALGALRWMEG